MITAYSFGHAIQYDGQGWIYVDDGTPVPDGSGIRPCPECLELPTPEGHDPCLGNLLGVVAACCGHGVEPGYWMCKQEEGKGK